MVYIFENGLIDADFDIDFKANSKSLKVDEILPFGDCLSEEKVFICDRRSEKSNLHVYMSRFTLF